MCLYKLIVSQQAVLCLQPRDQEKPPPCWIAPHEKSQEAQARHCFLYKKTFRLTD